ncbi:MDR family MFS transporter [Streptomyces sp. NPDC052051]|uniref:MDR family MFS transporter n=1 Tax=Streptomyces sp. NPDC052051 TaxID=3154649 RepID=UPI003422CD70
MSSNRPGPPEAAEEEIAPVSRPVKVVFYGLLITTFMAMMDQAIVATAGPTIAGKLGGMDIYAWVFVAYMLSFSIVMPVYGKMGDLFGRKPVFTFSIVTFLIGSAACGLAQSMGQLIVFRVVQGIGGGGLAVLAMAIIGELLEPRQRARYQGLFTAVFTVASVAGPVVGGLVTEAFGWRWVFFINLPVGIGALVVISSFLQLPRREGPRSKIDVPGILLLAAALTCLVLVTTWGGSRYDWTSGRILALEAGALVSVVAWLIVEATVAEPIIPLRLFGDSTFTISNVVALLSSLALFGAINFLPLFLQLVSGVTVAYSAILMIPALLGMMIASLVAGQVIFKTGRYKWFPAASMGCGTVALLLLSTLTADLNVWVIGGYLVLLGVAAGLSQQTVTVAAQNTAPPRDFGVVTSTVSLSRNVGALFGNAIFGAILTARLTVELPRHVPDGAGFSSADIAHLSPDDLNRLSDRVLNGLAEAYSASLSTVFLYSVPVMVVGFAVSLLMKNLPLQKRGFGPGGRGRGGGRPPAVTAAEKGRA